MKTRFRSLAKAFLGIAVVVLAMASASSVAAHGGASLSPTPTEGIHGQKVTVSGEGFEAGSDVTITLEGSMGSMPFAKATADNAGMFSVTVAISEDMTPGSYVLKAVGGDDTATADFSISEPPEESAAPSASNTSSEGSGNGSVVYQTSLEQTIVIVVALSVLILVGLLLLSRRR